MDDYVFLAATKENKKKLNKQTELGVFFLKDKRGLSTVTRAEIDRMTEVTTDQVVEGAEITVVEGYCTNMDGVVLEDNGSELLCLLSGWKRKYEVSLPRSSVVYRDE